MSTAISEFKRDKSHALTQQEVVPPLADMLGDITERQDALFKIQDGLYDEARRTSNFAKYMRMAVIFLGAFAATREVADRLFVSPEGGEEVKVTIVMIYTLMALAITVIGGISAALGLADKGAGLAALAAECNTHLLKVDCEMPREGERSCKRQAGDARRLIHYQNEKISAIQMSAAKMGVLVPRVRLSNVKAARPTDRG
jgi:hypothetical protein